MSREKGRGTSEGERKREGERETKKERNRKKERRRGARGGEREREKVRNSVCVCERERARERWRERERGGKGRGRDRERKRDRESDRERHREIRERATDGPLTPDDNERKCDEWNTHCTVKLKAVVTSVRMSFRWQSTKEEEILKDKLEPFKEWLDLRPMSLRPIYWAISSDAYACLKIGYERDVGKDIWSALLCGTAILTVRQR